MNDDIQMEKGTKRRTNRYYYSVAIGIISILIGLFCTLVFYQISGPIKGSGEQGLAELSIKGMVYFTSGVLVVIGLLLGSIAVILNNNILSVTGMVLNMLLVFYFLYSLILLILPF